MTSRSVLSVLALLLLVVGLGAVNYPLYDHVRDQRVLEQTGVVSSAAVVSTEEVGAGDDATYEVTWQVPGGDAERTSTVDAQAYAVASDQRSLDVRYPEGRPGEAYAVARTDGAPGLPTWVLWVDAGLLLLVLVLGATIGRGRVRGAADRFLGDGGPDRRERQVTA